MRTMPRSCEDFQDFNLFKVRSASVKVMEHIKTKPSHIQVMSMAATIWVILSETSLNIQDSLSMIRAFQKDRSDFPLPDHLKTFPKTLASVDRGAVCGGTVQVMDAMRKVDPSTQVMALLCLFSAILEANKLSANDLLSQIESLAKDEIHSERIDHRFSAMKFYFRRHLKPNL